MDNKHFPNTNGKKIDNPAMQLFGNRFYADQEIPELLIEFLLICFSDKRIGETFISGRIFPEYQYLYNWNRNENSIQLEYAPKLRLNLKLFSFLGASKLETRHRAHRQHYSDLIKILKEKLGILGNDEDEKLKVINTIRNLLLGFQGVGGSRTWCAWSFLPISPELLAGESIWKKKKSKSNIISDWYHLISKNTFFDSSQHLYFARGGEVLYLQICNALAQDEKKIKEWNERNDLQLTDEECKPALLFEKLEKNLQNFMSRTPVALGKIAKFIDEGLESETSKRTDMIDKKGEQRFATAGWCNIESWEETYLLILELNKILESGIDILETVNLLETACAMHVLRTLTMQSSRTLYPQEGTNKLPYANYRFVLCAPDTPIEAVKRLSQTSLKAIEKLLFKAIRKDREIHLGDFQKYLKAADKNYAKGLFIRLGKKMGLIIPKYGKGGRFVMTEQLLKLFVITIIPKGRRITFDSFKKQLEKRYGIVVDAEGLNRASKIFSNREIYLPPDTDIWLKEMLDEAGLLIHLSDSCALVRNTV